MPSLVTVILFLSVTVCASRYGRWFSRRAGGVLVYGHDFIQGLNRIGVIFASLGYAIPGSVIAVGVLLPFAWTDNTVDAFIASAFGRDCSDRQSCRAGRWHIWLGFWLLLFRLWMRGFAKISPAMDDAARSRVRRHGAGLRQVHWPFSDTQCYGGRALVFVDAIKELPATMILQPFNFSTHWLCGAQAGKVMSV